MATMAAGVPWQEILRQRLEERDTREKAYLGFIESYRRLAQQTRMLKERNQSLLRAAGSVRSDGAGGGGYAGTGTVKGKGAVASAGGGGGDGADNPVRAAYVASLETQLSQLRDEMASLYKTQGQNAQRLLVMNETLREREETFRVDQEELRVLREERERMRKKAEEHEGVVREKERAIEILQDDLAALSLEITQIEARNEDLKRDNASLLQRWLDRMNEEVEKMNDANEFYEEIDRRKKKTEGEAGESDDAAGAGEEGGEGKARRQPEGEEKAAAAAAAAEAS